MSVNLLLSSCQHFLILSSFEEQSYWVQLADPDVSLFLVFNAMTFSSLPSSLIYHCTPLPDAYFPAVPLNALHCIDFQFGLSVFLSTSIYLDHLMLFPCTFKWSSVCKSKCFRHRSLFLMFIFTFRAAVECLHENRPKWKINSEFCRQTVILILLCPSKMCSPTQEHTHLPAGSHQ